MWTNHGRQIADEGISTYLQRIRVNFPTFRAFSSSGDAVGAEERNNKIELVQLFQTELVDVQTFIWIADRDYTPDDFEKAKSGTRAKAPAEVAATGLIEDLAERIERDVPDITGPDQLAKARVGQGRFRVAVTAKWGRGDLRAN